VSANVGLTQKREHDDNGAVDCGGLTAGNLGAVGRPTGAAEAQVDDGRIVHMEVTDKQRAIEALRALPEHATIEDAIERLCFIAKIEEGLRQSDARQLVSHDEVKKQFLS
jgi:predicted transcriptional regulator